LHSRASAGRKISEGWGATKKKDRKIAKITENSTLKPLPRRRGHRKKGHKIAKKTKKIALLSLYLLYCICTMYENPERSTTPLPPAADAHSCISENKIASYLKLKKK